MAYSAVTVSDLGDGDAKELERFIGKILSKIDSKEHSLTLTFTDGSSIEAKGSRWDDCALGVYCEFTEPPREPKDPTAQA